MRLRLVVRVCNILSVGEAVMAQCAYQSRTCRQTWAFIKILTMIREWHGKFSMIKKQGRVQDGKFSKIGRQGRVQDGKFSKIGRDGTRTIILIV